MAIQQMGLMHYMPLPDGDEEDSAYLTVGGFDGSSQSDAAGILFNPIGQTGNVEFNSSVPENIIWKTGPNLFTDYEAQFNVTSIIGSADFTGNSANTWIQMGVESPNWTLTAITTPSLVAGNLAIRNRNTQIELANVNISLVTQSGV